LLDLLLAGLVLVLVVGLAIAFQRSRKPVIPASEQASATATPTPSATPAASPLVSSDLRALFEEEKAAREAAGPPSLFVPVEEPPERPLTYQPITPAERKRLYVASVKGDKKALRKVARIGGFRTPEDMAISYGYPSVQDMLDNWEATLLQGVPVSIDQTADRAQGISPLQE